MVEPQISSAPSIVPLKRSLEDDHAPSISSPLNPDAKPRAPRAPAREQREKKDSLKKRESTGQARSNTPEKLPINKQHGGAARSLADSPLRYNHPLPRELFHYNTKEPLFASHEPEPLFAPNGIELKKPVDHTENRKNYRYNPCVADPAFHHCRYYRQSDDKPQRARMSFPDSDKWLSFDDSATVVTNPKGWRMGRANVVAREGSFYYEVKILKGLPSTKEMPHPSQHPAPISTGPLPHVRVGWARREAPLDTPVGFDGYSYGLTDIRMEPMHKSRASKFLDNGDDTPPKKTKLKLKTKGAPSTTAFAANDHAREGDVIGLEINLPSLSLHRKVVDGSYNPAVDIGSGFTSHSSVPIPDEEGAPNIIRDRFPVPYKNAMYFESYEYRPSKGMEGYGDRGPFTKETPSPNHPDPALRSLPHSSIKVYKNGTLIGTAFRDLMAFLPPASAPEPGKLVRMGADDGAVGYFPAVGVFSGAIAQVNFGPDFWCPPSELQHDVVKHEDANVEMQDASTEHDRPVVVSRNNSVPLRGVCERYTEQIAEDVLYDIIDEVDFYVQDGAPAPSE